jgi:lipopolysaccharide transport system ATP-binding protein
MTNSMAIHINNLSKKYVIGALQDQHDTLRDQIVHGFKRLMQGGGQHRKASNTIWALKNISLQIQQGEVVGVIGPNGAGKSTLLKILSRITEPTEGYADIYGRVGALLEVGTGFHTELTGRENIYLSGAILGMRKAEITRNFDAIVAFAGIEKFIDTPVKRYSSGMHMRLAFAVAAHLEPEILIIDEVLAVGDMAFQKKCLEKMNEVAHAGKTILFVSHNMSAINELCSRVILLNDGSIMEDGTPLDTIAGYLKIGTSLNQKRIKERLNRPGNGMVRFTDVRLIVNDSDVHCIEYGQEVYIELHFETAGAIEPGSMRFVILFTTKTGIGFLSLDSFGTSFEKDEFLPSGAVRCYIPKFPLIRGTYWIELQAGVKGELADRVENAFEFEVMGKSASRVGYCTVDHQWELISSSTE